MKILVTGGQGFIGHNVVSMLEKLGHDVTIVDNKTDYGIIKKDELNYLIDERNKKIKTCLKYQYDICDKNNMSWLFSAYKYDIVIHLASFPRQKVVNNNPVYGSKIMSEGLLNLLEISKKHNVKKFVYVSSSMVYGDFEDGVTEDAICNPQGQYGIMKLAGEWLVKDYSRNGYFSHTIVRPSAVYGPLDVEDRVVAKFMLAAMKDNWMDINGASEALDFTYVDEVAEGIVAATLSENTDNKTYNISRGKSRTLLEAAELVTDVVGTGMINVKKRDNNFPSRGSLNIDAARRDFNFNPKIDIEKGFQLYYDWLLTSKYWGQEDV